MAIKPKLQLPKKPLTANEQYFDALVRHQIFLMRMSGSVSNKIVDLLNKNEKDLAKRIKSGLTKSHLGPTKANLARAKALAKEVSKIRKPMWKKINAIWDDEMKNLTDEEVLFLDKSLQTVVPVLLAPNVPPLSQLHALVNNSPFEGKTLKAWGDSIIRADLTRITDQIRIGIVQGENSNAISRRIIGTARLRGQDGVTNLTRKNALTITRTATNAFANMAKREFYEANADIVDKELYTATLDGNTTPICRSLDGKKFVIGEGPIPPLHMNCRSLRVAIIDDQVVGDRPNKPVTEKQLVREFTKKKGLPSLSNRKFLPRGTKGEFDAFARQRTRQLVGTVPAKTTYQQWLGRQSAEFQDDTLGVTKGRLFRRGGLTLDKFVNRRGDELTLSELSSKHKQAFINAGLDPVDF